MTWKLRSRRTLLASATLAAGVLGISVAVAQQGGGSPADPHIPNQPHNVAEYQQTSTARPLGDAPSPVSSIAPGQGRLAKLSASLDLRGWTSVSRPDFPISAKMPPGYFANFRVFNLQDGRLGYDLSLSNFDRNADAAQPEGAPALPGRVAVGAQLYPSGPGIIGEPPGPVTDGATVSVPGLGEAGIELRQRHWQPQLGPEQDIVHVITQVAVAGGRYLVLSAEATSPEDDHLVRELIGIIGSLGVK